MAQSPLIDTTRPVDSEEEGWSSTMDRRWLIEKKSKKIIAEDSQYKHLKARNVRKDVQQLSGKSACHWDWRHTRCNCNKAARVLYNCQMSHSSRNEYTWPALQGWKVNLEEHSGVAPRPQFYHCHCNLALALSANSLPAHCPRKWPLPFQLQ